VSLADTKQGVDSRTGSPPPQEPEIAYEAWLKTRSPQDFEHFLHAKTSSGASVMEFALAVGLVHARRLSGARAPMDSLSYVEAVNDVLLSLWSKGPPVHSVLGYLHRAIRFRLLTYVRKQLRIGEASPVEELDRLGLATMPSEPTDEHEQTNRTPRLEALTAAIHALPAAQRLVIVRTLLEGASVHEVAREMNRPPNTIVVLRSRGLKRLRDLMDHAATRGGSKKG